MAQNLQQLTDDEIRSKLKSLQAIQRTVFGIFAVIVLAWIVLGYWRTNTPVFISTLALALGAGASISVAPRALRAELERRGASN